MSSEFTLGCAVFMWLASVDVAVEPLHANKAPHGCIFPYLETSTEHRTEHFLMGGLNCCITFHTHEFLFLYPVGGTTMVTVARFLFFCPRASEQRVSHTEGWICHVPPYPCKVQGNHCFGSCSWLSPQIPHLKNTFLTCERKNFHHSSEFHKKKLCPLFTTAFITTITRLYGSTKRVPKGFYATHSSDVCITSF